MRCSNSASGRGYYSPSPGRFFDEWNGRLNNIFNSKGFIMTTKAPNSLMKKPVTDWVPYTPTFSAGLGTCTNINMRSRRVGSNLEIEGYFNTGTVAASEAQMSMGFNGVSGNVTSSSSIPSGTNCAGFRLSGAAHAYQVYTLIRTLS